MPKLCKKLKRSHKAMHKQSRTGLPGRNHASGKYKRRTQSKWRVVCGNATRTYRIVEEQRQAFLHCLKICGMDERSSRQCATCKSGVHTSAQRWRKRRTNRKWEDSTQDQRQQKERIRSRHRSDFLDYQEKRLYKHLYDDLEWVETGCQCSPISNERST